MLKTKNFGRKSLKEIKEILAEHGALARHEDRQLAADARALEGAAGAELSHRSAARREIEVMRHRNVGSEVRPQHQSAGGRCSATSRRTSCSTSASRRPTRRRRSSGASPSGSSPRPRASARSRTPPQDEARRGRQARKRLATSSGSSASYLPRCGAKHGKGRRDDEGRPRREGVRRSREALRDRAGWLHAHHQARSASRRQRADVDHRARREAAEAEAAPEGEKGEDRRRRRRQGRDRGEGRRQGRVDRGFLGFDARGPDWRCVVVVCGRSRTQRRSLRGRAREEDEEHDDARGGDGGPQPVLGALLAGASVAVDALERGARLVVAGIGRERPLEGLAVDDALREQILAFEAASAPRICRRGRRPDRGDCALR